ncbi:1,2-phenylacetyl-CoA epoxidase subunit PaaE [Minwuia thermotolerans]|uniref:Phenylacetate-CoA oxygenase/reductase subunit PaaK n=1 Tax=Minwuia thermotolerans TaxID=2056226 RepID=A0A2M9G2H9_9PROT|nr:1,2-phenylacetyl-CoA epoxidase subunit PaaE [Minwuia thermotolerans]PJK29900.1 phenylacetate-CoA oxygenase/reductase subunit PaaK [Minwuia thermotolerans]
MALFNSLKVADVRRETPDSVSIAFDVPEDLRSAFHHEAGQYLTLKADVDGREVRRSYSICSGPTESDIRVAIRRVEGGLFSTFANEDIGPGDAMEVMAPEGRFVLRPDPEREAHFVCFAAGSGITPILAIVKAVLFCEPKSSVTVVYGNRSAGTVIFREELEDLKNRFPARLSILHVLSREAQEAPLLSGRIDDAKLDMMLDRLIDTGGTEAFYLCGPQAMIETVSRALKNRGVERKRIRFELFTPAGDGNAKPKKTAAPGESLPTRHVGVVVDGHRMDFDMVDDGTSILDAALARQADLPFACKGGMCCTCRAKLVEGQVEMDKTYGLEPEEIEAGYVLTCQATPVSDRVVLDYDDRG